MGICSSGSGVCGKAEEIVDLERIVLNIAQQRISTGELSIGERLCLEKAVYLEVGWNYADFTHKLNKFSPPQDKIPSDFRNVTLFRTKFVNNSRTPQFYTFRTERQTKSTCSISVQKGFTLGANLNLEFALPTPDNMPIRSPDVEPSKISGGLSGQLSWSKTRGEVKEETLTWSCDSQVQVEADKTAWAALVVHEENLDVEFKLESTMVCRLKSKKIPVMVRRSKDKSLLEIIDVPCSEIASREDSNKLRPNFSYEDTAPDRLTITTTGTCKAVYGVEQVIQIETRPLLPSDDMSASLGGAMTSSRRNVTPADVLLHDVNDVKHEATEKTPLRS